MAGNQGLLASGWSRVAHNKRYIFWFYLLNVLLAFFGAAAFNSQVHGILDHSLQAQRLVHGFDIGVFIEMLARPEFGLTTASMMPAVHFAFFFFLLTALFLPGVLQGYASTYRLPRQDFFRACGRNLWRFVRLLMVAGIVMTALAAALFGLREVLIKKAGESTNELLSPEVSLVSLLIIFLVMAAMRIWFDLAQADIVLKDQHAVRKSIAAGFRHTWRNLGRLIGSYVITSIVAALVLVAGLLTWIKFVPPASVLGAIIVSQFTLLLLLIPRFWQRGVAVSYCLQNMGDPVSLHPFAPVVVPVSETASVATPAQSSEPQGA